jgi:purine-nucleoside phosphorylase
MAAEFRWPAALPGPLAEALAALAPVWSTLALPPGTLGVILGSGLGPAADGFPVRWSRPFAELGLPSASVAGHAGRLTLAAGPGAPLLFLSGRLHRYEGLGDLRVLLPAAAMAGLGLRGLLITNAAGGLDPAFAAGDFMLIEDILSLQLDDPLRGLALAGVPRQPPRRPLFDPALAETLAACADGVGLRLHRGVLNCAPGPAYETRAELRLARALGAGGQHVHLPRVHAARALGTADGGAQLHHERDRPGRGRRSGAAHARRGGGGGPALGRGLRAAAGRAVGGAGPRLSTAAGPPPGAGAAA